ncbi:UNVERIFIED_CONTAM: hypothetical protein Sradi_4394600 [Sesamum radiatum]|uniref:Uncharacterized protein n=1 Tax=Sesamum radiatum TaxID=300843 RepID=A0AAW2NQV4_SESRA
MSAIISSRRPIRSSIAGFGTSDGGGGGDVYIQLENWPQNQCRIHSPCSCPPLHPVTSAARSSPLMPPIRRGYSHRQPSVEADDPALASGTSPAKE